MTGSFPAQSCKLLKQLSHFLEVQSHSFFCRDQSIFFKCIMRTFLECHMVLCRPITGTGNAEMSEAGIPPVEGETGKCIAVWHYLVLENL